MIAAFLPIYRKNRFISSISCVIIWVLSSNPVVLVPHLATGFRFAPFTLPATLQTFLRILALHTSLKVPWLPLLLWLRPYSCYNPFHVLKANSLFQTSIIHIHVSALLSARKHCPVQKGIFSIPFLHGCHFPHFFRVILHSLDYKYHSFPSHSQKYLFTISISLEVIRTIPIGTRINAAVISPSNSFTETAVRISIATP